MTPVALFFAFSGLWVSAASPKTRHDSTDGLIYVWIPPGSYQMGCSAGDRECFTWEMPARQMKIERGFWIGQTEVTQRAYEKVMGTNPSRYRGADRPADQISWFQARKYCGAVGMRLPTEAEWEYAARAGDGRARYGGIESIAWYDGNSGGQSHAVASKQPNGFGLYDMLGNMWEWVEDDFSAQPGKKILRGGSFYNLARDVRVSNRLWASPETNHRNMGVRCAGN